MPIGFGRRENIKGWNKNTDPAQFSARECAFNPTRKKPRCEFLGLPSETRRLIKDGVTSYQNTAGITMSVANLALLKCRRIGPDYAQAGTGQMIGVDPDVGNGNQLLAGEQQR